MRQNGGSAFREAATRRCQGIAGRRNLRVAADMVRVGAGIDEETDGAGVKFPKRRQHLCGFLLRSCVHQNDAIGSGLNGNVGAGPGDHMKVRPQLDDVQFRRRTRGFLCGRNVRPQ